MPMGGRAGPGQVHGIRVALQDRLRALAHHPADSACVNRAAPARARPHTRTRARTRARTCANARPRPPRVVGRCVVNFKDDALRLG